jgi:hypothetical protein
VLKIGSYIHRSDGDKSDTRIAYATQQQIRDLFLNLFTDPG